MLSTRLYVFLAFGIFSLFSAVVGTCTGKVWVRYGPLVDRAKEPKQFWELIAAYYVGGVCFIGYFFYKIHELSN